MITCPKCNKQITEFKIREEKTILIEYDAVIDADGNCMVTPNGEEEPLDGTTYYDATCGHCHKLLPDSVGEIVYEYMY